MDTNGDYTGSPAEILPAGGEQQKRMSTIKNPEDKKRLSLERDRRNRYGENSKASRKTIPSGKQRRHMDERRTIGQVLGRIKGSIQDDVAVEAELVAKTRIIDSRRRGFKKKPDTPLGIVLAKKAKNNRNSLLFMQDPSTVILLTVL
jgi:hypothetical protein